MGKRTAEKDIKDTTSDSQVNSCFPYRWPLASLTPILYNVEKKASDLNYIITTPDRRKQKQLDHVKMLKEYVDRDSSNVYLDRDSSNVTLINVICSVSRKQSEMNSEDCQE